MSVVTRDPWKRVWGSDEEAEIRRNSKRRYDHSKKALGFEAGKARYHAQGMVAEMHFANEFGCQVNLAAAGQGEPDFEKPNRENLYAIEVTTTSKASWSVNEFTYRRMLDHERSGRYADVVLVCFQVVNAPLFNEEGELYDPPVELTLFTDDVAGAIESRLCGWTNLETLRDLPGKTIQLNEIGLSEPEGLRKLLNSYRPLM